MASGRTQRPFQPHIFVSVRHIRDTRQQTLLDAVSDTLKANGTIPILPEFDPLAHTRDPLPRIVKTISACHGAVILALNRLHITSGIEFPDSQHAKEIEQRNVSAVWDHIEAAMAYQAGLPLFILQERGLYQYGMVNFRRHTISFGEFSFEQSNDVIATAVSALLAPWCQRLADRKVPTARTRRHPS